MSIQQYSFDNISKMCGLVVGQYLRVKITAVILTHETSGKKSKMSLNMIYSPITLF